MTKISKMQKKGRATRAPRVGSGLSGYVVLWRHTMDDVPVGLFKTLSAATKAAKTMSRRASYTAAKRLDIDCSTPICYMVVEFRDGSPVNMNNVPRRDDA